MKNYEESEYRMDEYAKEDGLEEKDWRIKINKEGKFVIPQELIDRVIYLVDNPNEYKYGKKENNKS